MKSLLLLAALVAIPTGSVHAQVSDNIEQEKTNIEQVTVPGSHHPVAEFDAALFSDQPTNLGDAVSRIARLRPHFNGSGQFASIHQFGSGHSAYIDQQGTGNFAVMYQFVADNTARLTHNGINNKTALLQVGYDNLFDVDINGSNNFLGVIQWGNSHQYTRDIAKSNKHVFRIQAGHGNQVVEQGQGGVPLDIRQRGDGMELIIRHY